MGESKLMKPLFYAYHYNAAGTKMRAVFCRDISNGKNTYRLWRSAGKPDARYPRAENDAYRFYIELHGYLISSGCTDYELIRQAGKRPAYQLLYGEDSFEARSRRWEEAHANSKQALDEFFSREMDEIVRLGSKPECQADYISAWLVEMVKEYQESKENCGETPPNFIGALVLQELDDCAALFQTYRTKYERRKRERMIAAREEREQRGREINEQLAGIVAEAEQKFLVGGAVANERVVSYRSDCGTTQTHLISYLLQKYGIAVPPRTLGWINENLKKVTVSGQSDIQVSYSRAAGSRSKGSNTVFSCLFQLIDAIKQSRTDACCGESEY